MVVLNNAKHRVDLRDSHERKVEERADFIGCGVMGVGTNESYT